MVEQGHAVQIMKQVAEVVTGPAPHPWIQCRSHRIAHCADWGELSDEVGRGLERAGRFHHVLA